MNNDPMIVESVELAVQTLFDGNLVAIPTETVYGLAADATNPNAIQQVFSLKGRPADHPLIVHCHSAEQAWSCAKYSTTTAKLLGESFWPGPLTLVLPKADWVSPLITGDQDSVAVRVPSHPITQQVLKQFNRPLVAPSANRFGRVSPTQAAHVRDEFSESELLILDGGACEVGIESTIVDCRHSENYRILRPGKITEQDLERVFSASKNRPLKAAAHKDDKSIRTSGNLPSHYAPQANVTLVETGMIKEWINQNPIRNTYVISYSNRVDEMDTSNHWHVLDSTSEGFARELYALLRNADKQGFEQIVVELPKNEGVGIAIRDRLVRAAND